MSHHIMQLPFTKGLDLCQAFFMEAVRPLLTLHFPHLRYAAGRLSGGSDVLGFDTPQSRDHDWGPRLTLFLREEDLASASSEEGGTSEVGTGDEGGAGEGGSREAGRSSGCEGDRNDWRQR